MPHEHAHPEHEHSEHHEEAHPKETGALVLDIGGHIGALIIHTAAELAETEIEISPAHDPDTRSHNMVHLRRTPRGPIHNAVFPAVPAGDYTVWRDDSTAHGAVTIHGGQVTEYHWG
ncbi:MAG: hypothetical protein ACRDQ5_12685 [Sciscionella sp.]